MAHFTISNAAGTGMDMPYADASINDIIQSYGVTEIISDDGSVLFADMAETAIDVTAFYAPLSASLFNFTDFGFSVGGTPIGSINGVNLVVDRTKGEEFHSKVINASDDTLQGNDYADWIHGGTGNDTVLGAGADDVLFGDGGDDMLWGEVGEDYIDGGTGVDVAAFSGGLYEYHIIWITNGDTFVSNLFGNQGSDYVVASTEYLAFTDGNMLNTGVFGFHNGNFTGSAGNDSFLGASGNNKVRGGAGLDWLQGGSGNDALYGGAAIDRLQGDGGNDALYGGANTDAFVFDLKPTKRNKDTIKDFSVKDDFIMLENAHFKVGGSLSSAEFRVNTTGKAQDRSDKVIYDKDSGVLYYDADGTGSKAGVAFATISKNLKLKHYDFDVI
jgi:Ca2+-binding RTX toxin-like protein